jgi:thiosulfate dehydrogenase
MSEEDMRALYAYMLKGVPPVSQPNRPAEMAWPFSLRWGLSLWNWAFLDTKPFTPLAGKDAVWNRGAYLVQGPGHCGACHTPRGIAFQEKATSEAGRKGRYFLSGETMDGWRALSLRDLWTVADTVQLLKTGQNRFAAASGTMAEVVHHSTQHYTDADAIAVATYLKSLPPSEHGAPVTSGTTLAARSEDLQKSRGGVLYGQLCAGCHQPDGAGVQEAFPPLKQNPAIASPDPSNLTRIALGGASTPETAARPSALTMPGFAQLSDQEIAEVLSFVRASWGHRARPVAASEVRKARAHLEAMAPR